MPRNATTDPDSGLRFYEWQGRRLLSVTSLRRMLGMPFGLHNWAINQTIDAAMDIVPDECSLFGSAIVLDPDPGNREVIRKAIRSASMGKRDASANLGTRVHEAADAHTTIGDADPDVRPFLRQFYDAKSALSMRIVASEVQVFNLTLGYAGSLDLMAYVTPARNEAEWLALIDIKTGSGLYTDHLLQLLAYTHGEFIGRDDTKDVAATKALKAVQGIGILHLQPDDWEWVELKVSSGAVNAFADMARLANWMHENTDLKQHIVTAVTGAAK